MISISVTKIGEAPQEPFFVEFPVETALGNMYVCQIDSMVVKVLVFKEGSNGSTEGYNTLDK